MSFNIMSQYDDTSVLANDINVCHSNSLEEEQNILVPDSYTPPVLKPAEVRVGNEDKIAHIKKHFCHELIVCESILGRNAFLCA